MDTKKLVEMLKQEGLEVAEDVAVKLVNISFDWIEEEIKNDGKLDWKDMLLPIFGTAKSFVLSLADKIDGEDNLPEAVSEVSE